MCAKLAAAAAAAAHTLLLPAALAICLATNSMDKLDGTTRASKRASKRVCKLAEEHPNPKILATYIVPLIWQRVALSRQAHVGRNHEQQFP